MIQGDIINNCYCESVGAVRILITYTETVVIETVTNETVVDLLGEAVLDADGLETIEEVTTVTRTD